MGRRLICISHRTEFHQWRLRVRRAPTNGILLDANLFSCHKQMEQNAGCELNVTTDTVNIQLPLSVLGVYNCRFVTFNLSRM